MTARRKRTKAKFDEITAAQESHDASPEVDAVISALVDAAGDLGVEGGFSWDTSDNSQSAALFVATVMLAANDKSQVSEHQIRGLAFAQAAQEVGSWNKGGQVSEVKGEFPKVCDLCGQKIGTRIDLDWHGLGNCVGICERCKGSGIEPKGEAPAEKK